jgi:16S rRNA processing protein RimM
MKTLIGKFKAPHGVQGEIKAEIYLENADLFLKLDIFADNKCLNIENIRNFRENIYIIKLQNFSSPEEVKVFTNQEIFSEIENLKANPDDLILSELIGFSVIFEEEIVGSVVEIVNYGSGDAIEVEMLEKNGKKLQNNIFLIEEIKCNKDSKTITVNYIV